MATDLITFDPHAPSDEALNRAADAIRSGQTVALPTDALYALVADPLSVRAVRRIYEAKGRPVNRALPILVRDASMVEDFAREISPRFRILSRRFWPGPLTIILPASARVPLRATGNTGRLAVRQSRATTVNMLIDRLGTPLIATSANMTDHPTCATGIDVFGIMDGRVDLVLDGGLCGGTGATTVDITEPDWKLIKEGAVPGREIAECLEGT